METETETMTERKERTCTHLLLFPPTNVLSASDMKLNVISCSNFPHMQNPNVPHMNFEKKQKTCSDIQPNRTGLKLVENMK